MRTVPFEWGGARYEIGKITADTAVEFFGLQEELAAGPSAKAQLQTVLRMVELLNCPPSVRLEVSPDELEALLFALVDVQVTPKKAGQKADPPVGGDEASADSSAPPESVSPA